MENMNNNMNDNLNNIMIIMTGTTKRTRKNEL